ncbi:hypothetical protein MIND_00318000 [Mycena indigotica]|uniref:Uncharacterized protein n=1 Tax=Mycena indigotica TaxID=2126181 RepID=A0A8H6T337_9AGAR|nr:uncharacterized protein MIND_00318000 [Mycena indigotica]KAF7309472.1 hypothetical protein MIND_00318000 [Mycena indigotica]
MSLLRDIVKKRKDASKRSDAASVKSTGARSVVASLYSLAIGGQRVKKRRRPDFSTLGAPEWYSEDGNPRLPSDMPGTTTRTDLPAYTIAHGTVLALRIEDKNHWLSLVLYSHAKESSLAAMYHNAAKICGEVRVCLEKTKNISSIEVWMSAVAPAGELISLTATVWNRSMGDPRHPQGAKVAFKDKFPMGTFVFPFELPPLPKFVPVAHPDSSDNRKGFVPLPRSFWKDKVYGDAFYQTTSIDSDNYWFLHQCGVGIRRDSVAGIDEDMDMILQYIPLAPPLPRKSVPFPFLASREDWPFKRETLGGWVLTPFGGRGRIGLEMVEVEGLLGIQDPSIVTAGHKLEFVVILWSKSADALQLLGQPAAINVSYCMADFMPSSEALRPREQSRTTRKIEQMCRGRIWSTDTGRPSEGAPELALVSPEHILQKMSASRATPLKPPAPSRMQSTWSADDQDEDDGKEVEDIVQGDLEDSSEHFVRLEGEIVVPPCRPVSYRYTEIGREYTLELQFAHHLYSHISPTGPGLLAEVPVWYVADRPLRGGPATLNDDPTYLESLPLNGATIPIPSDAIRWPKVIGKHAVSSRGGLAKLGQSFLGLVPPKSQQHADP